MTLQPAAGAHGELTALMMFRAAHAARGDARARRSLIPDTAHGTNPATVDDVRLRQPSRSRATRRGLVDLEALRGGARLRRRGLHAHQPEHARAVRPATSSRSPRPCTRWAPTRTATAPTSTPSSASRARGHGLRRAAHQPAQDLLDPARRRWAGRRARVRDRGARALPARAHPVSSSRTAAFDLGRRRSARSAAFAASYGNFGVLVRAYTYVRALGAEGLREVAEQAVLSANYLKARLRDAYEVPYDRTCMHEFVLSGSRQKREQRCAHARHRQAAARLRLPPADRLLPADRRRGDDDRAHRDRAARMRSTRSADALIAIAEEAVRDPELVKNAPYTTPVRRLDEAGAARNPDLRWKPPAEE